MRFPPGHPGNLMPV